MKFWIPLIVWIIIRLIFHFTALKDKNFGRKFYQGIYGGAFVDFIFFFIVFYWWLHVRVLFSYIFAINIVTFLYYGIDKFFAKNNMFRVPEKVLLSLAFVGGSIGALIGMILFHHKTKKASFQVWFWILIIAQIGIIYLIYRYILR